MLVVQPTSTCDVCLDRYIWNSTTNASGNGDGNENNANEHFTRPHVITCGHVFCYQCLQNIRTPRTCPLCRASFHLQRAVRIHVDVDPTSDGRSQHRSSIIGGDGSSDDNRSENDYNGSRLRLRLTREEAEVRELEVRLVRAFVSAVDYTPGFGPGSAPGSAPTATSRSTSERGGDSADGDGGANVEVESREGENDVEARRNSVLEEVRAWLVNANAPSDAHPILRSLIAILPSYVTLPTLRSSLERKGQENSRLQGERDQLRRHLRRAERVREQEAALSRSSEKSYLAKVEEIERDCEQKITQARTECLRLEDELARIKVALKEAQATQSDILVQAQMQIREQNQNQAQNSVPAPPYSPRSQEQQPKSQSGPSAIQGPVTQTSNPNSTSEILFPRTSSPHSTSTQVQQARQARNTTSTSVSTSAYANSYDYHQPSPYSYDYSHRHNPLPPPPEPVPLSLLPAFARPKPGSRAYTNAKALAKHGTRRDRDRDADLERERDRDGDRSEARRSLRRKEKESESSVLMSMTDSEKDRRERRRERERERERESARANTETGADSITSRDRLRGRPSGKDKEKEKEKDRGTDKGTDTSATETQERRRARTRHASLVGMASSSGIDPYAAYDYAGTGQLSEHPSGSSVNVPSNVGADAQENGNINRMPAVPRDVVGGWGLERSWRASYASSHSGNSVRSRHSGNTGPLGASGAPASASASLEDLQDGLGETHERDDIKGGLGSSFTKMRVRERERGRESERNARREAEDVIKGKGKGKERERERHRDDAKEDYVFERSTRDETDRTQPEPPRRPQERHVPFSTTTSSRPFPSTSSDANANTGSSAEYRDTTHELPPLQPLSHSSYSSYAQSHPQSQSQRGEKERRTTLSAAPSALGLVLVPSPDGKGGYTYEYQYRDCSPTQHQNQYQAQYGALTLPQQSTICPPSSTGSANVSTAAGTVSGKESITPLAALTQTQAKAYTVQGRSINTVAGGVGNTGGDGNLSRASEYATLTRRATDSALRAHSQARAGSAMNNSTTADGSTAVSGTNTGVAPLHVPQPRRISLTIPEPEPESEASPQPQVQQSQTFRSEDSNEASVGSLYTETNAGRSYYTSGQPREQQQQQQVGAMTTSLYSSTNPNAKMSDSALASLPLGASSARAVGAPPAAMTSTSAARQSQIQPQADMQAREQTHTLRHRTSNSSTTSASSGGISLTGATKGERRKQLLDALFSVPSSSEDIERHTGRVVPEAGGNNAVGSGSRDRDGTHGSEASKMDARVGAGTSVGMSSSWSGDGKRVSLGRALDAASAIASTSGTAGTNTVVTDATRSTANAPPAQGHAQAHHQVHGQTQGQGQAQAPRGVPSRDGRPSRGLSTRPSTTQPVSSSYGHFQQQQQQYATSVYPATQATQFRQATYPASAYSSSASIALTQGHAGTGTTAYAYPTAAVVYQVPGAYANAHVHVPATYAVGYYAATVPHSAVRR